MPQSQQPVAMPMATPDDVTLYDGNTMTAADWRRLVEPVTGYTDIATSDLGSRRVRAIKHKGASKWVVTVDTDVNSWAYLIQPWPSETDGSDDDPKHPRSVYWAYIAAGTGIDGRITPAIPHRHFELPGTGTGIIAKTADDNWTVALWHGYIVDLRFRSQGKNFYVASAHATSVVMAMREIYQWFHDNEHAVVRNGVERDKWSTVWKDFETAALLPSAL